MFLRRIRGNSMSPALKPGDVVIGWQRPVVAGSIVLARVGSRDVAKRIERVEGDQVYLVGDNRLDSTDSRHYGNVARSAIIGTIMIVFASTVDPPKLLKPAGLWFGRVAAVILIGMALVHLFRIDTFIPVLDEALPGGSVVASLIAVLIILSEVFAIPFALRMKLSPLMHLKSGALMALAPLWWSLIGIWTFGLPLSTGELGAFVHVKSDIVLLLLNLIWLGFNYYTLYLLGYNRLSVHALLRK